jgi:phage terminase large subunit GpA-like protein
MLRLSEWAEQNIRLPAGVSSNPGPLRLWEFQRAIADSIGDPTVPRVSVLKSVMSGYSTLLVAAVASYVANDPAPIICLVPTQDDARNFVVHTLEPVAETTPVLAGLFADDTPEGARNTIQSKRFPGGSLKVIAAQAPRALRAHTAKVLLADEIDGAEIGPEGPPLLLAEKRTLSYPDRKIVVGSTPTVAETSQIVRAYEASDQRVFECSCPSCGAFSEVLWRHLVWEPDAPDTAAFKCPHCEELIGEEHKPSMVANGHWRVTRPDVKGHHGYRMNALISLMPNASWPNLVREFLQAKGDPEALRVFVNTLLGETWRETADQIDESALASRVEPFSLDVIPPEALILTAGCDVQDDRIEVAFVGWTKAGEALVLSHRVVWGSPLENETWREVDDVLRRNYPHPAGGLLQLDAAIVDSGSGGHTDAAYAFCKPRAGRRIMPGKGVAGFQRPATQLSQARHVRLILVGVDSIKSQIMNRLTAGRTIRFSDTLDATWFEQLCSERRVVRYSRGQPYRAFERISGRRAEALDCLTYAFAARSLLNPDLDRREADLASSRMPDPMPAIIRSRWLNR